MFRRHQTLIYHHVAAEPDPMSPNSPTADWFDRLIKRLKSSYRIISLSHAIELSRKEQLPRNSLSITFDDGYADNYEVALPILDKHGVPATFFVATGYLDGGLMWNDIIIETIRRLPNGEHAIQNFAETIRISTNDDRRTAAQRIITSWKHLPPEQREVNVELLSKRVDELPKNLMMSSDQLRKLQASNHAEIGGHTDTHPILFTQAADQARNDIETGRCKIADITGVSPKLFAYPNGKYGRDFSDEHVRMVEDSGFVGAVTTDIGYMDAGTDPYRIPRFSPWSHNLAKYRIDLARAKYGMI